MMLVIAYYYYSTAKSNLKKILNNVTLFQMIHFRFGQEKEDVLKRKDDFEAVKNIHFKD